MRLQHFNVHIIRHIYINTNVFQNVSVIRFIYIEIFLRWNALDMSSITKPMHMKESNIMTTVMSFMHVHFIQ